MRSSCSGGSSKENTPEASRVTPEATKLSGMEGPKFMLRLPATNKQRKKKKISPRTSPRILTEDAINLTSTNSSSTTDQKRDTSADKKRESEGGREEDRCPVLASVSTVKSLGGTAPTVLSQLRKGSVEQAIKSFEKLQSGD